jgi:hypothetical protein
MCNCSYLAVGFFIWFFVCAPDLSPVYWLSLGPINMIPRHLPKISLKRRLNNLVKNAKTMFFYMKLELFNMQKKRYLALFSAMAYLRQPIVLSSFHFSLFLCSPGLLEKPNTPKKSAPN